MPLESLQIFQNFAVVEERDILIFRKRKVRKRHHFLGEVCPEVFIHRGVNRQAILILSNVLCKYPGAPYRAGLLIHGGPDPGVLGREVPCCT